jgi:hypothetical protein
MSAAINQLPNFYDPSMKFAQPALVVPQPYRFPQNNSKDTKILKLSPGDSARTRSEDREGARYVRSHPPVNNGERKNLNEHCKKMFYTVYIFCYNPRSSSSPQLVTVLLSLTEQTSPVIFIKGLNY